MAWGIPVQQQKPPQQQQQQQQRMFGGSLDRAQTQRGGFGQGQSNLQGSAVVNGAQRQLPPGIDPRAVAADPQGYARWEQQRQQQQGQQQPWAQQWQQQRGGQAQQQRGGQQLNAFADWQGGGGQIPQAAQMQLQQRQQGFQAQQWQQQRGGMGGQPQQYSGQQLNDLAQWGAGGGRIPQGAQMQPQQGQQQAYQNFDYAAQQANRRGGQTQIDYGMSTSQGMGQIGINPPPNYLQPGYQPPPKQPGQGGGPTDPTMTRPNMYQPSAPPPAQPSAGWLPQLRESQSPGGQLPDWIKAQDPNWLKDNRAALDAYLGMTGDQRQAYQWDQENAWRQRGDLFQMSQQKRQQEMAEWQAQEQNRQWGADYNLRAGEQDFRQGLDRDKFGLDQELGRGRLQNETGRLDLDRELGRGRLQNESGRLDLDREIGRGNLDVNRGELDLARQRDLGRLGLDTELGRGRLSLDERQMLQDAQLSRERMASDLTQSRYAAFGRAQAPNTRMIRSWR